MNPPSAPKAPRKRLHIFQILLIVVVVGFAVWYLVSALMPSATMYATIQSGTLGARYSGDALIVRDETPYDAEGISSVEYVAKEGSVISRGAVICNVYSNGYSTSLSTALQTYRDEIKEYQMQLLSEETTYDAKMDRLVSDVIDLTKEFRQMMAGTRGNLLNQESLITTAIAARQSYLKQKYGSDQRLSRLYDDEQTQEQRIDSWTKVFKATEDDLLVSFYSDGYEYFLTNSTFQNFSPSQVRAMIGGWQPEQTSTQKAKSTVYRTIRDDGWYVMFLCKDDSWTPVDGQEYELKLERYENTTVQGTVVSSTRSGGELMVILRIEDSVASVLYMRTCTAEVGEYVQSLLVPARAVTTRNNATGVVVVDGMNKIFVPVNVLLRDGSNVYITALEQGLLYEGMTVVLY